MLLDKDTEDKIADIVSAMADAYLGYLVGGALFGSPSRPTTSPASASPQSLLTQAYLAGKTARTLGPKKLKSMSTDDLQRYVNQSGTELTAADKTLLQALGKDTERWVTGRGDAWKNQVRAVISEEEKDWRTLLSISNITDNQDLTEKRDQAKEALDESLTEVIRSMIGDAKRLVQTEMANYFQQGMVFATDYEEYVYKIPRLEACRHCLRLHLEADGSPKLYKVADVIGNSNMGVPASMWQFTIGPTHPYCYCILYFNSETPAEPHEGRAQALKDMKKAARWENSCGMPDDPNMLFEEQLDKVREHNHQHEHMELMLKAIGSITNKPKDSAS